jgi:hypothetical protein
VDSPVTMQSISQIGLDESARASASIARVTLQEHRAIQDCNARGESKGLTCTAKCLRQGRAQQEVAFIDIGNGAPLKTNVKGKSAC